MFLYPSLDYNSLVAWTIIITSQTYPGGSNILIVVLFKLNIITYEYIQIIENKNLNLTLKNDATKQDVQCRPMSIADTYISHVTDCHFVLEKV